MKGIITIIGIVSSLVIHGNASSIYWTDASAKTLTRAARDGSNKVIVASGLAFPSGVVVSGTQRKLFWTDRAYFSNGSSSVVYQSNLDGTGKVALFSTGLIDSFGITINDQTGTLYWADARLGKIFTSNFPYSTYSTLVGNLAGDPENICYNVADQSLIYSTFVSGQIRKYSLKDGSNTLLYGTGGQGLEGIVLVPSIEKIYAVDWYTHSVFSINFDGTGYQTTVPNLQQPIGIDFDPMTGKIIWVDQQDGGIREANLDGSNIILLATAAFPKGVFLYNAPLDVNTEFLNQKRFRFSIFNSEVNTIYKLMRSNDMVLKNSVGANQGDGDTLVFDFDDTPSGADKAFFWIQQSN